jgi:hypothetical protein
MFPDSGQFLHVAARIGMDRECADERQTDVQESRHWCD